MYSRINRPISFSIVLLLCLAPLAGSAQPAVDTFRIEIVPQLGHSESVGAIAFSPDGRILASGSSDNSAKLWDVASGRQLRTLSGHSSSVTSVAFSSNGRVLATGSIDATVKLWDVVNG